MDIYTEPENDAVDFELQAYTEPANDEVDFSGSAESIAPLVNGGLVNTGLVNGGLVS